MSPVYLAFSVLPCPHPPNPLPNGKGEIFCFLMQGASPLASPGLNPGDTGSTLRNRFFWCRRRTPVAVNKNFEKSSWGFGGFFQEAPKRFPAPCIPEDEPGRHWFDFKKPILFGVAGERRLQSIKISRKVLGGLGASFKKPPSASPPPASPRLNPGGTGSTLRNRFFWRRRRTPVAVNKNSRKVLGGLGASFKKPPTFLLRFSRRKKSGAVFTRG